MPGLRCYKNVNGWYNGTRMFRKIRFLNSNLIILVILYFFYYFTLRRAEKIKKLLDDELLVDCKFVVGPEDSTAETIVGHKVMFVLESPVLEKMLTGNFVESKNNHEIRITDVLPQHFKNFRDLVYTNDLSKLSMFTIEEIIELYHIANKYMVASISKSCLTFLNSTLSGLSTEVLVTLLEFACEIEDKTLLYNIQKVLANNGEANLRSNQLNVLSRDSFYKHIHYLSNLSSPPKPIAIFFGIESYFKSNGLIKIKNEKSKLENIADKDIEENKDFNNIRTFKMNLLKLVKFEQMTIKEFIDGPGKCELLAVQIKYDWLARLSLENARRYR